MPYGDVIAFMNREAAWYLCKQCATDVFGLLEKLAIDGYENSFVDFLHESKSIDLNYLAFQLNGEEEWRFEERLIHQAVEKKLLDPHVPWKHGQEIKRGTVIMLQEGYYHDQGILNVCSCTRCEVQLVKLCKDYP